jgi:hemerythrin
VCSGPLNMCEDHKEIHCNLLSEVAQIILDVMNKKEDAPQHLLNHLTKRIDDHILKEDMKYIYYCEECGIL